MTREGAAGTTLASPPMARSAATVAALYVDPSGVYADLPGVEVWDEARDARLYAGPWPVVAHPPCKSWSQMGNCRPLTRAAGDGGTFAAALAAVEEFGGVLEHPANTRAWRTFNLPKPTVRGWNIALHGRPGWATEVDQAAYRHPVHKPTWLYYVGDVAPPRLDWRAVVTEGDVANDGGGGRDQRSTTPAAFRDVLLAMARSAATVAALYVDPNGVYADLPGVEVWDEARDARLYAGPWPVVAHPPCNRWAKLGPTELRGQDDGCFEAALNAVRTWGGVLEHPAETHAWRAFDLPRPAGPWWKRSLLEDAWVCSVDQWHYGFPTRKPTWLYFVGASPPSMPYRIVEAEHGCDHLWSTERAKTPPDFADVLLAMARSAGGGAAESRTM